MELTFLVPLKSLQRAKSRVQLGPERRRRLVRAMAADTLAAAAECGPVMLVLADPDDAAAVVVPPGLQIFHSAAVGLNPALQDAAANAVSPGQPVAVLPADLPFLTGAQLGQALGSWQTFSGRSRAVLVTDHGGTGTTLLVAPSPALLRPRFGPGSRRAHLDDGAHEVILPVTHGLRRDVDVLADLRLPGDRRALGAHTRAEVESW